MQAAEMLNRLHGFLERAINRNSEPTVVFACFTESNLMCSRVR